MRFGLKTVRAKLIAMTTLVIAGVLAILGFGVDLFARSTMLGVVDRDLRDRATEVVRMLQDQPEPGVPRGPGFGQGPPGNPPPLPNGPGPHMQGMHLRRHNPRISAPVILPAVANGQPAPPALDARVVSKVLREGGEIFSDVVRDGESTRVYTAVASRDGHPIHVVQLAYPLGEIRAALAHLRGVLLTVVLPIGMLLAAGASLLVVGRLLDPLRRMNHEAARIGGSSMSERLEVRGEDEFAQLAGTVNGMLSRIQTAFERERRFTADASHELKTPLAVVKANAGLLVHGKSSPDEARESARAIDTAADRMSALVRDLLTLARVDEGRPAESFQPVDLEEVIRTAVESVPGAASRIQVVVPDRLPSVMGSGPDLVRAFVNLIDNAVKYAPESPIRVRLENVSDVVTVRMEDSGPGISPDHLPHLFERFYRPDEARSSDSGGTGLGLAIVKAIVELHGGKIAVESKPGSGTAVAVWLPASVPPP